MEKPRNRLEQVNQIFFKFVDYVDLVSKAAIGEGIDATTMEHIKKISPTIIVGKCLDIDGRYKALIEREYDQVLFTLIGDFVTGCDVEQTSKKALNIIQPTLIFSLLININKTIKLLLLLWKILSKFLVKSNKMFQILS